MALWNVQGFYVYIDLLQYFNNTIWHPKDTKWGLKLSAFVQWKAYSTLLRFRKQIEWLLTETSINAFALCALSSLCRII